MNNAEPFLRAQRIHAQRAGCHEQGKDAGAF
jgi:hypothetical protein